MHTHTHGCRDKAIHECSQICLPSHLWILSCIFLTGISTNFCHGTCKNTHSQHKCHFEHILQEFQRSLTSSLFRLTFISQYSDLLHRPPHHSDLAAIPRSAQKRRCRMPQTLAKRPSFLAKRHRKNARIAGILKCCHPTWHRRAPFPSTIRSSAYTGRICCS